MFVDAIDDVQRFTRPIHTITRNYNEKVVSPGSATLFFVNELGCAVTCKHVVELIGNTDQVNNHYKEFCKEKETIGRNNKYTKRIKELEAKYNIKEDVIVQIKTLFPSYTSEPSISYKFYNHPKYDLSIIVFQDFKNPLYQGYARFLKDENEIKQGKFLCRLGYPFTEFTNFRFNEEIDDIEWTVEGQANTPQFPIEGMVTRHLHLDGEVFGLEMSTPGLRGQSGGPLFDNNGVIYGMQSFTRHLHLGFDMKNQEYISSGKTIKITSQPMLHVGWCIKAGVIKSFLKEHNIKYYEA